MASTASKTVAQQITAILQESKGAVTTSALQEQLHAQDTEVMDAVQQLVNDGIVKLKQTDKGELGIELPSVQDVQEQQKLRGLDTEERLVYQIIENAETKGIWIRDIRIQSNLQNPRLTKILKNLESRQLVKTVKLHSHTNKKIYMLFHLSPSEELTGGAWYVDGNLDEQLVDTMRHLCVQVIRQQGAMTIDSVTAFVKDKLSSDQKLSSGHVKQILQTLTFDGLIDEQEGEGEVSVYASMVLTLPDSSPLSSIPCGQCPVISECAEGNDVSPSTCQYMAEWLQF